jgi:hypothetical protein
LLDNRLFNNDSFLYGGCFFSLLCWHWSFCLYWFPLSLTLEMSLTWINWEITWKLLLLKRFDWIRIFRSFVIWSKCFGYRGQQIGLSRTSDQWS